MSSASRLPQGASLGRRAFGGVVAAAFVGVLAACAQKKPAVVPSAGGVTAVVTVAVIDNKFEPAAVEIKAGQALRWVFSGVMEHDVVAEDGSFVSELQAEGEYVHVFEQAGEYPYDCSVHPEMTGSVTVR
ncbi:MAG: cupredoxin domain-containing protein [Actinobacteria bacterium]|nr:cupredoxin domain-containing protein [Actinomycetota bacterium]